MYSRVEIRFIQVIYSSHDKYIIYKWTYIVIDGKSQEEHPKFSKITKFGLKYCKI